MNDRIQLSLLPTPDPLATDGQWYTWQCNGSTFEGMAITRDDDVQLCVTSDGMAIVINEWFVANATLITDESRTPPPTVLEMELRELKEQAHQLDAWIDTSISKGHLYYRLRWGRGSKHRGSRTLRKEEVAQVRLLVERGRRIRELERILKA